MSVFCAIEPGHPQYVSETEYLKVIRNRTPYSLWDGQGVLDDKQRNLLIMLRNPWYFRISR